MVIAVPAVIAIPPVIAVPAVISVPPIIAVPVVITIPAVPVTVIPEPVRVDFSVMNIPVSPYVIPVMPSDFIRDSVMIDDHPSAMAIMA